MLLSDSISFERLGLVVVDEEQQFGVKQKEKLKALKHDSHILSLSATPIPRTLQMSLLGIRDLSLIATPPIARKPVKTQILDFDGIVIRDALMREYFRGGKSFYVTPRISDLDAIAQRLKEIVPELRFKVAHGQMKPSDIDEIMTEFYDGKFDILLSTTIIGSGIDVPAANTMIIHNADMFGLGQLYQLRGRVGRGKIQAFAYLLLKKGGIKDVSMKRLEVLQNYESLGSGFSVASHDMDSRGFGNLVGEAQSGNVREVGAELYQDMLRDALDKLKAKTEKEKRAVEESEFSPRIKLGIEVAIPEYYIEEEHVRSSLYRRIAALNSAEEIEEFVDEMVDRFGEPPQQLRNLLDVIYIKKLCREFRVEKIDVGAKGFSMKIANDSPILSKIFSYVNDNPESSKFRPDNKLVIIRDMKKDKISTDVIEALDSFSVY